MEGVETSEELRKALAGAVRNSIGAFAAPDVIHWVSGHTARQEITLSSTVQDRKCVWRLIL